MSSLPHASIAVCTSASGTPSFVRLPEWTAVSGPISRAVCFARSSSRSLITTLAPCSASISAVARPMPRALPVTIATLSSRTPIRSPCSARSLNAGGHGIDPSVNVVAQAPLTFRRRRGGTAAPRCERPSARGGATPPDRGEAEGGRGGRGRRERRGRVVVRASSGREHLDDAGGGRRGRDRTEIASRDGGEAARGGPERPGGAWTGPRPRALAVPACEARPREPVERGDLDDLPARDARAEVDREQRLGAA